MTLTPSATFHGMPHIDHAYCYNAPGLEEVDFQLGRLGQASIPELYKTACASQSIDSDGTVAGQLSRPSSSEVRQDFKAAPDAW